MLSTRLISSPQMNRDSLMSALKGLIPKKKDISDQQKEVLAEAKGCGYDIKVIGKLITLRRCDQGDLGEEKAVLELYKEALGMS